MKDRHLFRLRDAEFFWGAGIVKDDCFAMLTTAPGRDLIPYHNRQVCVLPAVAGMDWLTLARGTAERFKPLPAGTLTVATVRKDGVDVAA